MTKDVPTEPLRIDPLRRFLKTLKGKDLYKAILDNPERLSVYLNAVTKEAVFDPSVSKEDIYNMATVNGILFQGLSSAKVLDNLKAVLADGRMDFSNWVQDSGPLPQQDILQDQPWLDRCRENS